MILSKETLTIGLGNKILRNSKTEISNKETPKMLSLLLRKKKDFIKENNLNCKRNNSKQPNSRKTSNFFKKKSISSKQKWIFMMMKLIRDLRREKFLKEKEKGKIKLKSLKKKRHSKCQVFGFNPTKTVKSISQIRNYKQIIDSVSLNNYLNS